MDQYLSNIYIIYLYIIFHLGSFMGSKLPWFRQVSTPMALPSPFAAVPEAIDVGIEPLGFSGFREQKLRVEAVEMRIFCHWKGLKKCGIWPGKLKELTTDFFVMFFRRRFLELASRNVDSTRTMWINLPKNGIWLIRTTNIVNRWIWPAYTGIQMFTYPNKCNFKSNRHAVGMDFCGALAQKKTFFLAPQEGTFFWSPHWLFSG